MCNTHTTVYIMLSRHIPDSLEPQASFSQRSDAPHHFGPTLSERSRKIVRPSPPDLGLPDVKAVLVDRRGPAHFPQQSFEGIVDDGDQIVDGEIG